MDKICPKCGARLEVNAIFCDECGERISVTPKPTVNNENLGAAQNKKQSGMGIASFVLGIISMVTLGIFFFPEIVGVVLGIMGLTDKNSKKSFAIMGTIFSAVAILMLALFMVIGLTYQD